MYPWLSVATQLVLEEIENWNKISIEVQWTRLCWRSDPSLAPAPLVTWRHAVHASKWRGSGASDAVTRGWPWRGATRTALAPRSGPLSLHWVTRGESWAGAAPYSGLAWRTRNHRHHHLNTHFPDLSLQLLVGSLHFSLVLQKSDNLWSKYSANGFHWYWR